MVYYKGGLTYKDMQEMPIAELLNYQEYAQKINDEIKKQIEKK